LQFFLNAAVAGVPVPKNQLTTIDVVPLSKHVKSNSNKPGEFALTVVPDDDTGDHQARTRCACVLARVVRVCACVQRSAGLIRLV
jgi:hypothetical protein